jgi:hypothetical protein
VTAPDPVPPIESVFRHAYDRHGVRLEVVFGNHAPGGLCPYFAAGACFHCQHGAGEGAAFTGRANLVRLRWYQARHESVWATVGHLVVHNAGSVLNPAEMPPAFLAEVLAWCRKLPKLSVLSLESRGSHITADRLQPMYDQVSDGVQIRPCLGVETLDDTVRNAVLEKHMSRAMIVRVFAEVGALVQLNGQSAYGLDVNLVVGAPGVGFGEAVADVETSMRWLVEQARIHAVPLDVNLHPYYPSQRGWEAFPTHPACSLELLIQCAMAANAVRAELRPELNLYLGWHDDDRSHQFSAPGLVALRADVQNFNHSQSAYELKTIARKVRSILGDEARF